MLQQRFQPINSSSYQQSRVQVCLLVLLPLVSCDEWQLVGSNLRSEINTTGLWDVSDSLVFIDELTWCVSGLWLGLREQQMTLHFSMNSLSYIQIGLSFKSTGPQQIIRHAQRPGKEHWSLLGINYQALMWLSTHTQEPCSHKMRDKLQNFISQL